MTTTNHSQLPVSWETIKLGELAIHEKGKKPIKQAPNPSSTFPIPYIDIRAFEDGIISSWTNGLNCRICYESELLMVWDGARSGLVGMGKNGALGSTLVSLDFPIVDNKYAYYFFQLKFQEINSRTKGSGTPHVDPDLVWNYEFPVPPFPEQRRIVAKIEELFSKIDNGIESLNTAREKLDAYCQAVLKHAFEGKLTSEWRKENKDRLETPEQLLTHIKQEREAHYEQQIAEWKVDQRKRSKPKAPKSLPLLSLEELNELPELPEGWIWSRFGLLDIQLKRGPFGSSITKSMFVPSGFKVYEQGNAIYRDATRGSYFINNEKYEELSAFTVLPGDIIVSCAGTVGRIFELPENAMAGVINQALMRIRINDMILSKRFFTTLFESAFFQQKVLSDAKGTAMVNLAGIKELNLVQVAICCMSEQKEINRLLDARLTEVDQCERRIDNSLQQAEALRQSILKKAFSGKLVPQDPSDEHASSLLERIKVEKAARSQVNKREERRRERATA